MAKEGECKSAWDTTEVHICLPLAEPGLKIINLISTESCEMLIGCKVSTI